MRRTITRLLVWLGFMSPRVAPIEELIDAEEQTERKIVRDPFGTYVRNRDNAG